MELFELVVGTLEDGFSQPDEAVRLQGVAIGGGLLRFVVVEGGGGGGAEVEAVVESAVDKGTHVRGREDIAAPGVVLVGQSHLGQECGREVALVHQRCHLAGSGNGSAGPYHGDVEEAGFFPFADSGCLDAMVWQDDDEQVLPLRCLAHATDELPKVMVCVAEGCHFLVGICR